MSQFATIYSVPKKIVDNFSVFHTASKIKNKIFSKSKKIFDFDYNGYSFLMAAQYLSESCDIPILDSRYNRLCTKLAKTGGSFFILDYQQCYEINKKLELINVTPVELEKFYEVFNETTSHGQGEAMLAGIDLIRKLVASINVNELFLIEIQ